MRLVLPQNTIKLINGAADNHRHPGLQLDKFSIPGDQQAQKTAIDKVCKIPGDPDLLASLTARCKQVLESLPGATRFCCETTGPFTLHLSRASALENAGICLHPLYGFAYLPGSGLKGMARAYAETVWLPVQAKQTQAWRRIEDVFGWAPSPDRRRQIKDPDHPAAARREDDADPNSPEIKASSGAIVFHDAWPTTWPRLVVDIVNNHHPHYYQNDDNQDAPGDWEDPVPVYFLAVRAGTVFTFTLSKRRADVAKELVDLAGHWLLGALCHLGAGAKTNAGYGAFKPVDGIEDTLRNAVQKTWENATAQPGGCARRAVFETTLELITPAFLAGADQYGPVAAGGCDLRPATLRGHLRWWWRTMHAGFLDVKTLRTLEAAIWGDTHAGGAVRIELSPRTGGSASPYTHPQDRRSGTRYVAFGMDEKSHGVQQRRYLLTAPASWGLRLIARATDFFVNRNDIGDPKKAQNGRPLTAIQVLDQAKAALWLLCTYGGVGSKARKGFGSLAAVDLNCIDLGKCTTIARNVRRECSIDNPFSRDQAESPSISDADLQNIEICVQARSVDDVIDRIGRAYSAVASRFKHNVDQNNVEQSPNKGGWGLPRKIHGPRDDGPLKKSNGTYIQNPDTWQPPEWLDFPRRPNNVTPHNARHASPIQIHVGKNPSSEFVVRVLAMPAVHLTNRAESVKMLRVFVDAFRTEFAATAAQTRTGRRPATPAPAPRTTTSGPTKRPPGTPVRVRILAERPKGYDVQEEDRPQGTLTVGTPPDTPPKVDEVVDVFVHVDHPKRPQYKWQAPQGKLKSKPKGGRPGGRPGGRR